MNILSSIYTYGRLIKFSHTVFAMPFALSSVLLASKDHTITGRSLFWIIVAMVCARSAAMGFNRWADRHYDKLNARTSNRPSVTGLISPKAVMAFTVISSVLFVISALQLGKLCFWLSFPTLFVLFSYSYTKRFTSLSHLYLGFAIGLAPIGSWIAVTGGWDSRILPLSLALMTYIAGFDILYACQDLEFDRKVGLFSLPSRFGVKKALFISRLIHGITFVSLVMLDHLFALNTPFELALVVIGFLLVWEHLLVRPEDLSKVPIAFFHVNSLVSVALFAGIGLDVMKG